MCFIPGRIVNVFLIAGTRHNIHSSFSLIFLVLLVLNSLSAVLELAFSLYFPRFNRTVLYKCLAAFALNLNFIWSASD